MRILVISAHPDDEVSGCAGTLIKHRMQGDEIHWCIVTTVYTPMWSEQEVFEKAREASRRPDAICPQSKTFIFCSI